MASLVAKGSPLQRNDNVFGKLSVAAGSSPFVSKGILWIHKNNKFGQLLDPAMDMIPIDSPKPSHDSRVTVRSRDKPRWIPLDTPAPQGLPPKVPEEPCKFQHLGLANAG